MRDRAAAKGVNGEDCDRIGLWLSNQQATRLLPAKPDAVRLEVRAVRLRSEHVPALGVAAE